jgi:hypothetical protein
MSPGLHTQGPGIIMELAGLPFKEEEKQNWAWHGTLADAPSYNAYLHRFADAFLPDLIRYGTKVVHIGRHPGEAG